MNWSDIPFRPPPKTLRQFAGLWLVFFLGLAAWQGLGREHPQTGAVLAAAALAVGLLGLAKPDAVRWIFVAWMVLAFPVGYVVSQVMLAVLFFGIFTPVALFFRIKGRDLLHLRHATGDSTYWSPKPTPRDVRRYFRQF